MLFKFLLGNCILTYWFYFVLSTFPIFKAMFSIYETAIKQFFTDEALWVKSPLVLMHWQSAFPALSPLMPRTLQVHFIGLHSEKRQSADKTLSVIYHLDILSWLTKCTDFFFLIKRLLFFTVKERSSSNRGKNVAIHTEPKVSNREYTLQVIYQNYIVLRFQKTLSLCRGG